MTEARNFNRIVNDTMLGIITAAVVVVLENPPPLFMEEKPKNRREQCLDIAREAITKDRNADYGDPEDNFRAIAAYWNTHLYEKIRHAHAVGCECFKFDIRTSTWTIHDSDLKTLLNSIDIATMMVMMKMARTITSPAKMDNWADSAGYSGCGADVAGAE